MSQKWENVFSHHQSQANVVTDEQLKFQIFANLPLNVFRCFTNIRSLIVGEYQQKCTNFQINRKIQEYYNKLSESDEWNGLLKDLKFNGSHLDENNAKIWLLSKREQNRVYAQSTHHQKRFLFLPKNVLLRATNFEKLVHATAAERGAAKPGSFVDDIFKSLPKIDSWIPALTHLKFDENPSAESYDENEANLMSFGTPSTSKSRKRKIFDDKKSEETNPTPAKQGRRRSSRLQSKERVIDEKDEQHVTNVRPTKQSKIPLPDKKRKSKSSEIINHGPNEFQLKIQQLNVEDFVVKTNIKKIISDEYRNQRKDSNAKISDDEFTKRLLAYNVKRMDMRQWNRSGLKNLQFVDDEPEENMNESTTTSTLNVAEETFNRSKSNIFDKSQAKRASASAEPSDFQKEIMAMNYETFINETNVKELVRKSFETETIPLTDAAMEAELKKLDEQRYHFRRYHKGLLNHLKMLKCECQRNKKFEDKSTQTDATQSQDADAQCDSVESGSNEMTESVQNDHSPEDSCHSKLSMLSVHEITESEIIQIKSISSTVVAADIVTTTQSQARPPNDLSPTDDGAEFDSSSFRHDSSQKIEDFLAMLEMDYDNEDQNVDEHVETELPEVVVNQEECCNQETVIQPDSSADGITTAQGIDLQDESEISADIDGIIPQSEVVDYLFECEVRSENVPDYCDQQQNSTAVGSLATEADLIDPEIPIESNTDENQLNSTQPAGVSGEEESVADAQTPCQTKPFIDAENSIVQNDSSVIQEPNSSETVDSFRLSSFNPNEKSTPVDEEKSRKTLCQTKRVSEEKRKSLETKPKPAKNVSKTDQIMKQFLAGIRENDPDAYIRLGEALLQR